LKRAHICVCVCVCHTERDGRAPPRSRRVAVGTGHHVGVDRLLPLVRAVPAHTRTCHRHTHARRMHACIRDSRTPCTYSGTARVSSDRSPSPVVYYDEIAEWERRREKREMARNLESTVWSCVYSCVYSCLCWNARVFVDFVRLYIQLARNAPNTVFVPVSSRNTFPAVLHTFRITTTTTAACQMSARKPPIPCRGRIWCSKPAKMLCSSRYYPRRTQKNFVNHKMTALLYVLCHFFFSPVG